ncbi:MAG: efflux RND transporter permease subunit, partial [Leptospira sp.]|nr:efflux RND transporter permease subunit [Leptospira sp.]
MFYLALMLFGILSIPKIKLNLLPNIEFPRISIVTALPNSSPEEIENLITKPLTDSVGTVNGIEKVNSESAEGISQITLQFNNKVEVEFAVMEVRERIDLVKESMPQDASKPVITRFDPSQSAIIEVVFSSKSISNPKDLRTFLAENIKVFLERVDGVGAVQFSGGYQKEIQIEIDSMKMNSFTVSPAEVAGFVTTANMNFPAGSLPYGNKDLLIRAVGEFKSIQDIGKTVVGTNQGGVPVYLSSFSNINESYKERTGIARYNQDECVVAYIYKESGKNTVAVADNVIAEIAKINNEFSKELSANVVYNESEFVKNSIYDITQSLISGTLLAFITLILILRNFRSPIILLTVVPVSLLTTLLFFNIFGISLNMMSMGGLALGIGMLFDTSNVVLSGIERNLSKKMSPFNAAIKGVEEVTSSVISATLTTVIVFLPILFIRSIVGVVFAEMALSITISLSVSLLVSVTLIPMLASLLYKQDTEIESYNNVVFRKSAEIHKRILNSYEKKMNEYLDNPRKLFIPVGILFLIAIQFLFFVRKEFIPKVDTGEFSIEIKAAKGTLLNSASEIVSEIEKILLDNNNVQSVISKIGYDEDQLISSRKGERGTHRGRIRVILKSDRDTSTGNFISNIRQKIKFNNTVEVVFIQTGDILSSLLSSESGEVSLEILGDEIAGLISVGDKIKGELAAIPGVTDIKTSMEEKTREYSLEFDEVKAAQSGLTNDYLANYLKL